MKQTHRSANRTRSVFLDVDCLSRWDESEIFQRFPQAEKVAVTGLEPGPPGSWDARVPSDYPNVLFEDGMFRMWYSVMPDAESHGENADHSYVCYAESEDGLTWRKPDLGITGQNRYPGNNLLAFPGFCMGVVRALPGSDFKYLAASIQILPLEPDITDVPGNSFDGGGTFIFGSDDGLHWRQLTKVCRHGDNCMLFADVPSGRYLLYQKVGVMHGMHARRSFIVLESRDAIHWEGYGGVNQWQECFLADDYDDIVSAQRGLRIADYYGVTIHRVGDLYVSLENVFTMGTPLVSHFGQSPAGLCHFRLGFSHDGTHWRHPAGRPAWLEVGLPGEFDAGFMAPGLNLLEHGDEMLLYYSGFHYRHGWCINADFSMKRDIPLSEQRGMSALGLARIKRDRFASLASTYKGRFEMDPSASGNAPSFVDPRWPQLYINARCPKGAVRVGLVEAGKGTDLPGYSLDDCIPFTGDSVRAPVQFRNASVADIPADKPFYLRFEVSRGEVFGYEWEKSGSG